MIGRVKKYIDEKGLISHGDAVIVALSGGADSVCLFHMLHSMREEYGITLYAVHVNHGIREDEAKRDEEFAAGLARRYGVLCSVYVYDVPKLAYEWKMSLEEAGRRVRYEAFEEERIKRHADSIAVAHHQNDQVETVLFRMCRGTGIRGMKGMPSRRGAVIRPLMCLARRDIEEYLDSVHQEYVEDSTNADNGYDRNRIRNIVIPELERINGSAVSHICGLSEQIGRVFDWYDSECDRISAGIVEEGGDVLQGEYVQAGINELASLPDIFQGEVIRKMIGRLAPGMKDIENRHIAGVLELLHMNSGKEIHLPYSLVAVRQYDRIRLYRRTGGEGMSESGRDYFVLDLDGMRSGEEIVKSFADVYMPDAGKMLKRLVISFEIKEYDHTRDIIPKNNCTKWFDCGKMKNKLIVRRISEGDYFLIGNNRHKKLSRYMIDMKIPRQYRDSLLVLSQDDNVIHVAGGRTGSGCYVDDGSRRILQMRIAGDEQLMR